MKKKWITLLTSIIMLFLITGVAAGEESNVSTDDKTPKSAIEVVEAWAKAVQSRNGVVQFSLLSKEMQEKTRKQYEEVNWVTGVSSPWVGKYMISKGCQIDKTSLAYDVTFYLMTSTGSAGEGTVKVTVSQVGGKWVITDLKEIKGSTPLAGIVIFPTDSP